MSILKLKLNVDKVEYTQKPSEYNFICNRLKKKNNQVELSIHELSELIKKGCFFTGGLLDGTKSENWKEQQFFVLDIDNDREEIFSYEDATNICKQNGIEIALAYYTFSSTEQKPRYRLCFICDEVVTDAGECKKILEALFHIFPSADKQCIDLCRMYAGTNKGIIGKVKDVTFCKQDILALYEREIAPSKVVPPRNEYTRKHYCDDEIDLESEIRNFNLLQYIQDITGNRGK